MMSIGEMIAGAKRYVMQQFKPDNHIFLRDPKLSAPLHDAQWFTERIEELSALVPSVSARGIDLGAAAKIA